ncbi:MAG: hypothetical protein JWM71_1212 [Solirubrobacteraceae bacterium]|nr:hypothetical protein [Solirubrobacteraceae bacterium]
MHGHGGQVSASAPTGHPWDTKVEIFIAVMLGLAAIAGAFAAYKNEGRDHESTIAFNEGIRHTNESAQAVTEGNQVYTSDSALFLEYAKAANSGDQSLSRYILTLMSPTLRAGVGWWAKQPNPPKGPTSPLVAQDPKYGIPQYALGARLRKASDASFTEAKAQQRKADRYTLIEVILASALFLYGVAGVTRNFSVKIGALSAGGVIFIVSMVLLITV